MLYVIDCATDQSYRCQEKHLLGTAQDAELAVQVVTSFLRQKHNMTSHSSSKKCRRPTVILYVNDSDYGLETTATGFDIR